MLSPLMLNQGPSQNQKLSPQLHHTLKSPSPPWTVRRWTIFFQLLSISFLTPSVGNLDPSNKPPNLLNTGGLFTLLPSIDWWGQTSDLCSLIPTYLIKWQRKRETILQNLVSIKKKFLLVRCKRNQYERKNTGKPKSVLPVTCLTVACELIEQENAFIQFQNVIGYWLMSVGSYSYKELSYFSTLFLSFSSPGLGWAGHFELETNQYNISNPGSNPWSQTPNNITSFRNWL